MCDYLEDEYKIQKENEKYYEREIKRAKTSRERAEAELSLILTQDEIVRLSGLLFIGDY